ncbi:N-acetylmuramoyl-L-alanine amidase [Paraflavisolibacter sp. H34]|uniref:N-acetylmuramoyl-L-alanine amidase n=1 Tax=Huijunlia imazamoxiresistens TaxID=3127457 RepID=UPI0030178758
MIPIAFYLLKVTALSGALYLYYRAAMRSKGHHGWNRFYLLAATALSLLAPLLELPVGQAPAEAAPGPIRVLQVVTDAGAYAEEMAGESGQGYPLERWAGGLYAAVSAFFLVQLGKSLLRVRKVLRQGTLQRHGHLKLVHTSAPATPFSFLGYIFWNRTLDPESETGRLILRHEQVHVEECHTLDKLFLQAVLVCCWCNPVFWIIRKELGDLHEFLADRKAVGTGGTPALAAMILQAAYPGAFHDLTHPFFQTSIKRRLAMLTKDHHPRSFARLLALPVLAVASLAFTLKTKNVVPVAAFEKEYIVVIDPGHGYMPDNKPNGAMAEGLSEDDLVLAIAQKIKAANTQKNLRILLTREDKKNVELRKRTIFTEENKADLFISLHLAAASGAATKERTEGIEVYIPAQNQDHHQQSTLLGSALIERLGNLHTTFPAPLQRKTAVWVLNNAPCPAALIECGYLTDKEDREFIRKEKNQEQVAAAILQAIGQYAARKAAGRNADKSEDDALVFLDGKEMGSLKNFLNTAKAPLNFRSATILNGDTARTKHLAKEQLYRFTFSADLITVKPADAARKKYGEKGRNGVYEFVTRKEASSPNTPVPAPVIP